MSTGVASACPQCGAPLRFGGAHSLATVCGYCRSAVARAGAGVQAIGKVPDLVATDSRLAIGARGRGDKAPFTILGRIQLDQGAGAWNEWYAAYDDGQFGWLAEAEGGLYITRLVPPPPGLKRFPHFKSLYAGQAIALGELGTFSVEEVGQARFVSAEGELPFTPKLGATYRFADATSGGSRFVTLDFGAEGEVPELFAGREVDYGEVGLGDLRPLEVAGAAPARALVCPGCGAPPSLKVSSSKSLICPSCRSVLAVEGGELELLGKVARRREPLVPLGSKGTLHGEALQVIGYLRRAITVDGTDYEWSEYLLHGKHGYRWLSEYAGHWSFLKPIPAGKVQGTGSSLAVVCDGRHFKHFQTATARYVDIHGEFYWRMEVNEQVEAIDYVAPPYLLSAERTPNEISWTRGEYMTGEEVWKGLALPGKPPPAVGVGAAQPNPYAARAGAVWKATGIALAVLIFLALFFAGISVPERVLVLDVPIPTGQPPISQLPGGQPPAADQSVTLSEPFEITGGWDAVEIQAYAPGVHQAWIGLDIALIEDATGEADLVGIELSQYSGVEDGESWSEGSVTGSEVIGSVPSGRYVLRVEPQVDRGSGALPSSVRVEVVRGVFLWPPLLLALALLILYPITLAFRASAFETKRWAESDHAPSSGDDDDE